MPSYVRIAGSWKEITHQYVRVSGTWRPIRESYVRVSGTWRKVFDLVTPGSTTYSTPGTYNFVVPAHNTVTAKCNGAGGGSSGFYNTNDIAHGCRISPLTNNEANNRIAGSSNFNTGLGSNPNARGGQSGFIIRAGPTIPNVNNKNDGGVPGTANGGSINLSGSAGGAGLANNISNMVATAGQGGGSPNGGSTILTPVEDNYGDFSGLAGSTPGGGARGAYRRRRFVTAWAANNIYSCCGGGGGGYSERSYATFNTGQSVQLQVGLRQNAVQGSSTITIAGAPGANGRVIVEWS